MRGPKTPHSKKSNYFLDVNRLTSLERAVEEVLKRLCFANRHGQARLTDAVLAVLRWIRSDRDSVATCLLCCEIAAHAESESRG